MFPSETGVIEQVKRIFIMEMSYGVHVLARDSLPVHRYHRRTRFDPHLLQKILPMRVYNWYDIASACVVSRPGRFITTPYGLGVRLHGGVPPADGATNRQTWPGIGPISLKAQPNDRTALSRRQCQPTPASRRIRRHPGGVGQGGAAGGGGAVRAPGG